MFALRLARSAAVVFLLVASARFAHAQAAATAYEPKHVEYPENVDGLPGVGPISDSVNFKRLWPQRRQQFVNRVDKDHGALVFLGDSITQGWGNNLGGQFGKQKVANRGISGDTTRGMLVRLDDVIALDPSGVVMLMGTNDLSRSATPEMVAGNVTEIIAKLKEHNSEMPIVLCAIMPSAASKDRPKEKIVATNKLLHEAVNDDPQVTFLDTWNLFANEEGDAKLEEFPDLLHPNKAGYAKWAAALRPVLATHGFLETEANKAVPEEGFELLFNGHDLTGWGLRPTSEGDLASRANWQRSDPNAAAWPIVTEAKSFDGESASDNGRFVAKNSRLVVTTPSEGRRIEQLWTKREFPNDFTLKLEFRATPNADSGVYIRGPQLQCRDYPLAGPYHDLKKYRPQDWNEIVVEVRGGVALCTCNGEVLEEEFRVPPTGPIGLEGDRGQMEYRRIRVKEMR